MHPVRRPAVSLLALLLCVSACGGPSAGSFAAPVGAAGLVEPHLPVPDPCVLGTWQPAHEAATIRIDDQTAQLSGRGGPITFRQDGTGEQDYGAYPNGTAYTPSRYVCSASGLLGVSTDGGDVVSLSR